MKRGKFSKVEIEYIKNNKEKTLDNLSEDLGRTKESIQKVLAEIKAIEPEPEKVTPVFEGHNAHKFMSRKVVKGNPTATIMTQASSEIIDESKKLGKLKNSKAINNDVIFKPMGNIKYNDDGTIK